MKKLEKKKTCFLRGILTKAKWKCYNYINAKRERERERGIDREKKLERERESYRRGRKNMRKEIFICSRNKKNGGVGEGENVKVVTFLYAFYVIRFILHKLFLSQNSQKNGP